MTIAAVASAKVQHPYESGRLAISRSGPVTRAPIAVLLGLVLIGASGRAIAAEGADAKSRANALLAEARGLYERGEYGDALGRLNQAYALFPSRLILFNFGQVNRALLRDVEAIDAFERFLSEGPDNNPDLRREAELNLIELSRRVGMIEIGADVDRAEVHVDGTFVGTTPLKQRVRVVPGRHLILVQPADDAIPFVGRVEVAAGETARVQTKIGRPTPPMITAAPTPPPTPIYRKWWLWTAIGIVLLGAVITTLAITSSNDECKYNGGCIQFP
jgi:tetratricopeptide (TPR) repeat protein